MRKETPCGWRKSNMTILEDIGFRIKEFGIRQCLQLNVITHRQNGILYKDFFYSLKKFFFFEFLQFARIF